MISKFNKYLFYLLASSLLFISSCSVAQTVSKPDKELHKIKGYLLFAISKMDEEIIFLPDSAASRKYSFEQLQKIKGWYLRGHNTYEMFQAKQKSKKHSISVPLFDARNSNRSFLSVELGVLPVELTYWETSPGKLKEDSGIPFDYKGKRYVINYIDDWDIVIEKIKVIK